MSDAPETFDNFIHLSVDLINSATDMIEEIGGLKIRRRSRDYDQDPRDMLDLRKAVSKAVRALESYDAMAAAGRKTSTGPEFCAARNQVAEINWCSNAEASKALGQGLVPPECSINEAGALVIPETQAGHFVRGSSLIRAYFDEIVTTTGCVVKSRDGEADDLQRLDGMLDDRERES